MRTLNLFALEAPDVPMSVAWYLADVDEAKGKQRGRGARWRRGQS